MSEQLHNPMPDDSEGQINVKEIMEEMDTRAGNDRKDAERGIEEGFSPREIINEFGGPEETRLRIGDEATDGLLNIASGSADPLDRAMIAGAMPDSENGRDRIDKTLNSMEAGAKAEWERINSELVSGRPAQDVLDELGGPEEASRIIGEYYTKDLLETVREENEAQELENKFADIEKGEN